MKIQIQKVSQILNHCPKSTIAIPNHCPKSTITIPNQSSCRQLPLMREADTEAPLVVHGHCPPAPKRHQSLFNHWLLNPPLEPGRVGALAEARANPLPEPPCAGTLPQPTRVGATADGLSPHHWILVFGAGHRRWPHRHPSPLPPSLVGRKEEAPDLPLCTPPAALLSTTARAAAARGPLVAGSAARASPIARSTTRAPRVAKPPLPPRRYGRAPPPCVAAHRIA